MVRAMNLAMTVGATPVEKTTLVLRIRRSVYRLVTLVTEPGHAYFEEKVIDRAMRFVTIGTIIDNRRMLKKKWSTPLCMAGVTVFVNAVLLELRWVGASMRVMAVAAGNLPFPQRHVGRTQELGLSLQVTLAADFRFCPLEEKRRLFAHLGELKSIRRLFHDRVAINTGEATAGMGTCFPVGLHAALMTRQTGLVLNLWRLPRIFAERDQPADPSPTAGASVVTARSMTALAGFFLRLIAWVVKKNLSHDGGGKLFKVRRMTGLAGLAAYIGCRGLRRFSLCRPNRLGGPEGKNTE